MTATQKRVLRKPQSDPYPYTCPRCKGRFAVTPDRSKIYCGLCWREIQAQRKRGAR